MSLWHPLEKEEKKKRNTKLGPRRDAAGEIGKLMETLKKDFSGDPKADTDAFEKETEQQIEKMMVGWDKDKPPCNPSPSEATAWKILDTLAGWGGDDRTFNMTPLLAMAWVATHQKRVQASVAPVRWKLKCYENADYICEARQAALEAVQISLKKNKAFEGIFWRQLGWNLEHLWNDSQLAESFYEGEDGSREDNRIKTIETIPDRIVEKVEKEMLMAGPLCELYFKWAGWIMSDEEFAAWTLRMTPGRRLTDEQIGKKLGITRQGAANRIEQARKKVGKAFREIGLTFDEQTGEITSGHKVLIGVGIDDIETDETPPAKPARKQKSKNVPAQIIPMPVADSITSEKKQ